MKVVLKVTPRNILIATLMPIACAALFVVATWLSGLNRYDSSYFTDEYLERYSTPGATAMVLAEALRANDTELLAESPSSRAMRRSKSCSASGLTPWRRFELLTVLA